MGITYFDRATATKILVDDVEGIVVARAPVSSQLPAFVGATVLDTLKSIIASNSRVKMATGTDQHQALFAKARWHMECIASGAQLLAEGLDPVKEIVSFLCPHVTDLWGISLQLKEENADPALTGWATNMHETAQEIIALLVEMVK